MGGRWGNSERPSHPRLLGSSKLRLRASALFFQAQNSSLYDSPLIARFMAVPFLWSSVRAMGREAITDIL